MDLIERMRATCCAGNFVSRLTFDMEVDFSGSMAIKFYGVGVILDMVFRSSEMDCLQMNSHQVGVLQILVIRFI